MTGRQRLGFKTVADWLEDVPGNGWQRLSAGDGAKGPRLYDWAWLPHGSDAASGWRKGLLIRRKLAQPEAFTFYLTLAPAAAGLPDLVRVAGTRWIIEACFEAAKSLPPRRRGARSDRTSTRCVRGPAGIAISPWRCWRMPISPCFAVLPVGKKAALDLAADLLPLTVPEVRRLLWYLVWARPPDPEAACAWSHWRRRHPQRARQSHWKRRTSHETRL